MKTQQEIAEMANTLYPMPNGEDYLDEPKTYESYIQQEAFIKGYQAAQEEVKQHAIQFLESIRDYERENGDRICNDERSSEELYEIFITKP